MSGLFDYVASVSHTKVNMMRGTENDALEEKGYEPFMMNRAFSLYQDTVLYAAEIAKYPEIPKIMQYEFYLHSLRSKKRFSKWPKRDKLEALELIKKHYGYNAHRALEALSILTEEQINKIKEQYETGGKL